MSSMNFVSFTCERAIRAECATHGQTPRTYATRPKANNVRAIKANGHIKTLSLFPWFSSSSTITNTFVPFCFSFRIAFGFRRWFTQPLQSLPFLLELSHSRVCNGFLPSGTGFHCILEPLDAHPLQLAFALSTLVFCLLPFCNHQQRPCNLRVCPHACLTCIRNNSRTTTIHTPPMHERLPLRSNDKSEGTTHSLQCVPKPAIRTHS